MRMRISKPITLVLLWILCDFSAISQTKRGFRLESDIEGLVDGAPIYLTTPDNKIIYQTTTKNSQFLIEGYIEGDANYYFLKQDTLKKKESFSNALWLVNGDMTVEGTVASWNNLKLIGSDAQDDWEEFKDLQNKNKEREDWSTIKNNYINRHLNSLFVAYLIRWDNIDLYDDLGNRAKESYYGLERAHLFKTHQVTEKGIIPNFQVITVDGEIIEITNLIKSSKFTLIDFWASWCGPCRDAIPRLKEVYNTFHAKGFNIVGISTDKKVTAWKRALSEEKMPWPQGLDFQGFGKSIFNLAALPGYILIDQDGKIIQSELTNQLNSTDNNQIRRFKDKSLSGNIYEIMDSLLK